MKYLIIATCLHFFSVLVSSQFQERVSVHDPTQSRRMWHIHLQSSPLYGNSTELQYFYVNVYVGSQRFPQALIADTGSGIAAIPCKNYCVSCGKHINSYFDVDESETKYFYDCQRDRGCSCFNNNKCHFTQSYGEGSSYSGFLVKDQIHFGESHHPQEDAFNYTFGCVTTETHLFYSQDADGILGLSKGTYKQNMHPIYEVMKEANLIEKRMFSLCLGKNGGYFQIGGYDGQSHMPGVDGEVKWIPLLQTTQYKIELKGLSLNNHLIDGSLQANIGFIDSGTTFSYFPAFLWNQVLIHFDWFCGLEKAHCKGPRILNEKSKTICFKYIEKKYPNGPKDFFLSYPILNFHMNDDQNKPVILEWYPSEYLYRDKEDQYCLAVERYQRSEVIIGGSLMRQHNFIFDVDSNKVGIARASCNDDFNQVKSAQEMIDFGQRYGLDPNHTESLTQICAHREASIALPTQTIITTTSTSSKQSKGGNREKKVITVRGGEDSAEEERAMGFFELLFIGLIVLASMVICCCCLITKKDQVKEEEGESSHEEDYNETGDSNNTQEQQKRVKKHRKGKISKQGRDQFQEIAEIKDSLDENNRNKKNYYVEFETIKQSTFDNNTTEQDSDEDHNPN